MLLTQSPPVSGQQLDTRKSALEGRVLQAGSEDPIGGAQFNLGPVPTADGTSPSSSGYRSLLSDPNAVFSDRDGRFVLNDIDPGFYYLAAISDGFSTQCYGAKRPGVNGCRGSTVLKLEPGQTAKDIVIRMTRGGVITGRLSDPNGQPLVGMAVDLLRDGYDAAGRRGVISGTVSTVVTNDRGEYRIYGIDPGRYYVTARPPLSGTILAIQPGALRLSVIDADTSGVLASTYAITFYPGVTEIIRDSIIEIQPGSELNGMDFSVRRLPISKFRIRGRIFDSRPGHSPESFGYSITPNHDEISVGTRIYYTATDGTFESPLLVPGSYRIRAQISSPVARPQPGEPPPIFPTLYASSSVDIVSADVEGVKVTFAPPVSINGRLSVEGKDTLVLLGLESLRVRLRTTNANSPQPAPIQTDGAFSLDNMSVGNDYGLTLSGLPPDMYVKEARYGDIDLLSESLRISDSAPGSIKIVIGTDGGRIVGILRDERRAPVAYTQVVLIPDLHRERRELYKTVTTDDAGRFTFRGIAPGDYKIYAWDDVEPYAYFNADFISQSENFAAVHISESEERTIDAKIIPSKGK